jgi:hypothetical protein
VRTDCLDTRHQECMARTHVSRKIPFSCLPETPRVSVQSRSRDSPQENDGIPFTIPIVGRQHTEMAVARPRVTALMHSPCRLLFGEFAKLRKSTIRFVISVFPSLRPHGKTRLPLDGFS